MNRCQVLSFALVSLVLALPNFAAAEEGGWKMPSLNPFAKKSGPPTSSGFTGGGSGNSGSGWKMPSLWPKKAASTFGKPAAPSTWQKMQTGTRNFWSKTADAINPFDDANDNQFQSPTGSNSAFRQATMSKGKDQKSNSFLPSWNWGGEEKEKKPQTVQDFLALPRPM